MTIQPRASRTAHWANMVETSPAFDALNPRYREIAQFIADGDTLKVIADRYGISCERVRQMAAKIEAKLRKAMEA